MKSLLKILMPLVVIPYLLHAQDFCGSLCNVKLDIYTGNPTGKLQCKISTIPSIAHDVFEGNSTTLKRYFGTGETVCDVLGWMNEGVPFMREHYEGLNMSVGTNLLPFTLLWI